MLQEFMLFATQQRQLQKDNFLKKMYSKLKRTQHNIGEKKNTTQEPNEMMTKKRKMS